MFLLGLMNKCGPKSHITLDLKRNGSCFMLNSLLTTEEAAVSQMLLPLAQNANADQYRKM